MMRLTSTLSAVALLASFSMAVPARSQDKSAATIDGRSVPSRHIEFATDDLGQILQRIPEGRRADAVFDTSLIYELSVLKVFAERSLLEVPQSHQAYPTAFRLLRLLDNFVALYPDHVPPTSILREFLGGCGFEY